MGGWPDLTACHASIAWPSSGSTGLVNEMPVLWVGTSRRQTASRARTSPESPGMGRPSCCQRMQPTGSRAISSLRWPANSQVSVMARMSSTGSVRPSAVGRSPGSTFRPAHSSSAQMSSAITRGSGPMRARTLRGVLMGWAGANRRGINSHSRRSRKNARGTLRYPDFDCGVSGLPRRPWERMPRVQWGCSAASQPDLGQHAAVEVADLRSQCRGGVPTLDPLRPPGRDPSIAVGPDACLDGGGSAWSSAATARWSP